MGILSSGGQVPGVGDRNRGDFDSILSRMADDVGGQEAEEVSELAAGCNFVFDERHIAEGKSGVSKTIDEYFGRLEKPPTGFHLGFDKTKPKKINGVEFNLATYLTEWDEEGWDVKGVLGRIDPDYADEEPVKAAFLSACLGEDDSRVVEDGKFPVENAFVVDASYTEFRARIEATLEGYCAEPRLEDWIERASKMAVTRRYFESQWNEDDVVWLVEALQKTKLQRWQKFGLSKTESGFAIVNIEKAMETFNRLSLDDAGEVVADEQREIVGAEQYDYLVENYGEDVSNWPPRIAFQKIAKHNALQGLLKLGPIEETVSLSGTFNTSRSLNDAEMFASSLVFFTKD